MPISSEAEILAARVSRKPMSNGRAANAIHQSAINPHSTTVSASPHRASTPVNGQAHLTSGFAARINSKIKLELFSSDLDRKNRRLKNTLAFIAKVLFWAAAAYVIIL